MTDRDRDLQAYLEGFLTPHRRERLQTVLNRRTRHVTIVLDNVHQSHNISAVLRSCEAFGLQDVHVIESHTPFQVAPDIAAGTAKWLTLHRYRGPEAFRDCLTSLKSAGYRVVVARHGCGEYPETIPIEVPLAIVIGNESVGISPEMQAGADGSLQLPMEGFVESFNLSVAAALCLSGITRRLRESDVAWTLPPAERADLLFQWVRKSVPNVRQIEQRWTADHAAGSH